MKVKVLKEHGNGYDASYVKEVGKCYEMPDEAAKPLIASGLVEKVDEEAAMEAVAELQKLTVADLDKIIEANEIDVAEGSNKAAKIDAIIEARNAKQVQD